jgi:hypothetical protein
LVTLCHHLYGIKNLDITRATTEVRSEVTRHIGTCERRTLLVDLSLRANNNPRYTKSALQSTASCKRVGVPLTFSFIDSLKCDDGAPSNFVQAGLATDHRFAVDENSATSALSAGRATVFG